MIENLLQRILKKASQADYGYSRRGPSERTLVTNFLKKAVKGKKNIMEVTTSLGISYEGELKPLLERYRIFIDPVLKIKPKKDNAPEKGKNPRRYRKAKTDDKYKPT